MPRITTPLLRWASLVVAVAVLSAGLVIALSGPAEAEQFATLRVLEGTVEVGDEDAPFRPGRDGQILRRGDTVRTGADGRAEIEYWEGSLTRLDRGTVFSLRELHSDPDVPDSKTIVAEQSAGRTFERVVDITDSRSRFDVELRSATVSVRGTSFVLDQRADGAAELWVVPDEDPRPGRVGLILEDREVVVREGEGVVVPARGGAGDVFDLSPEELADEWVAFNAGEGDAPGAPELVLEPDGLGAVSFGRRRGPVVARMTRLLGEPDETEETAIGGGSLAIVRWGHLELVFLGPLGGGPMTFDEYWFSREMDPQTGALQPWRPAPWEEELRTSEGIGIGSPAAEANAAYPRTFAFSFVRDLCQEAVPNVGLGGGLDPRGNILYLTPELHGLNFRPLLDGEVWFIGANSEESFPLFCHT